MRHPFKRYCFTLAEKLGKHIDEILALDSSTITEWMAYHQTCNEEWLSQYRNDEELNRQSKMDADTQANMIKSLFGLAPTKKEI